MNSLIDFINKNQSLKQLLNCLELGLHTFERNILFSHLKSLNIENEEFTNDHVQMLHQLITDEMVSKKSSHRDIIEMNNVLSVFAQTAVAIQSETVSEEGINSCWIARYFDCVKNICDKDLCVLWSKLLMKELKQPNTIFLRTLDVFHRADKFEIDWFNEITKFVLDKACIPEFVITGNKFYQFNKFQTLIDAGFVNPSLGNLSFPESDTIHMVSVDIKIDVLHHPFAMSVYTLTDAGMQIFDLNCEITPDEYINKLKDVMEAGNRVRVEVVKR